MANDQRTELSRVMSFLGSRKTKKKADAVRANLAKANAARLAKKADGINPYTGKSTS